MRLITNMERKISLVLKAASVVAVTVPGAIASDVVGNTNIIRPAAAAAPAGTIHRKRSLSQSLLGSFFAMPMPMPKFDRCWAGMETYYDDGEQRRRPAIDCEFVVPHGYNSTADIRLGSCRYLDESTCQEKVSVGDDDDDACAGPFVVSGRIRTTAYPDMHPHLGEKAEFNHTYCARADVYEDTDGSGKTQTSFAHVEKEIVITFTGGKNNADGYYSVGMEKDDDPYSENNNGGAARTAMMGLLIGILIVIPVVALFSIKKWRRGGGTKIHESSIAEGQVVVNPTNEVKDGSDVEIEIV